LKQSERALKRPVLSKGTIEVELKAWAGNLKSLCKKIEKIAQFQGEIVQRDTYFTFASTKGYQKQRFRLREIGNRSIVTVKIEGKSCPGVEANEEHEFEVSDPQEFKVFCREFGFRVLIEKTKKVSKYLYKPPVKQFPLPVTIELNRVQGLGNFIEIETLVRRKNQISRASLFLKSLLHKLGIPESKIEQRAYTELLYAKKIEPSMKKYK